MQVDDLIKAVAAATFTAGVTETVSVTREAGCTIGGNLGPRRGDGGVLGSTGYQPVGFGCQPKRTLIQIAMRF